ncbi:endoribonuclease ZC3H12A-like isoform X1 [Cloeon dipterum]|uniref:endoribonuclease ZC3H12A-like isoform X1 n=1 Tax=Cloeon dipterum TaxID=197152 RepID=UPI00321FA88A
MDAPGDEDDAAATATQRRLVSVRRRHLSLLNPDRVRALFGVTLRNVDEWVDNERAWFAVSSDSAAPVTHDLEACVQRYIDSSCTEAGGTEEDSSYDSDCESAPNAVPHRCHDDVSRTVSDTLGAEFAEYVSSPPPGYTQKVEFGLKLGYTERQVQVALAKIGDNPSQNELLAELIKLGAAKSASDFSPTSDVAPCFGVDSFADCENGDSEEVLAVNQLRHIVIDGSNVAMSHGNKEAFSCRGIKLCVEWFQARGHQRITVFVPRWRKEASRPERPIKDQEILNELEQERIVVFTPSRHVNGKRVTCYDDRYILRLAHDTDGVVVSNDNYRDLLSQSPEFRKVVEERILMYSFVNDKFMPPDDPLGRSGPTLDKFLRVTSVKADPPRPCPYGKKCTYGNKCKYAHPERGPLPLKSISERLAENAQRQLQARASRDASPGDQSKSKSLSLPPGEQPRKTPLSRTRSSVPNSCNNERQGVSKSKSVENVAYNFRVPPPHSQYIPPPQQQQQQQQMWTQVSHVSQDWHMMAAPSGHLPLGKQLSDPPVNPEHEQTEPVNLHRKLQRQLTLNPAFDARLLHLQHGSYGAPAEHRPIGRCTSSATDYRMPHWGEPTHQLGGPEVALHQSVTRIASAPEPLPPCWPPAPTQQRHVPLTHISASSEPNLMVPPQWTHMDAEVRSRINYHLSSLFPAEQVQAAMNMLPEETNPQKICALILTMFHKP